MTKLFGLVMLIIGTFLPWGRAAGVDAADWLAFGELRGYLEPCGCDPATDLGGLRRLAVALSRERTQKADVLIFDLGRNLPYEAVEAQRKTPYLIEGLKALRPKASLFQETELLHRELIRLVPVNKRPSYVLSNVAEQSGLKSLTSPYILNEELLIFGFASPSVATELLPAGEGLLRRWRATKARLKATSAVLLFAGSDVELELLMAGEPFFDAIISANTADRAMTPGSSQTLDEVRLLRQVKGKDIYMVPLGGLGLLRGGRERFSEAQTLSEILKAKATCPPLGTQSLGANLPDCSASGLNLAAAKIVTWLDQSYGGDGMLAGLFHRYAEAQRQLFSEEGARRLKDLDHSPYVGAEACKSCHPKAFAIFETTKHRLAMTTLENKGKQEDLECVVCHAVGVTEPGGFVSLAASPHLAGVQCEVCHGPRKAHAMNPLQKPVRNKSAREVCTSCHHMPHSSAFAFDVYWPKIVHGRE